MQAVESIKIQKVSKGCVAFSIDAKEASESWKRLWIVYLTEEGSKDLEDMQGQKVLELPGAKRKLLVNGSEVLETPVDVLDDKKVPVFADGVTIFGEI